ncbi:GNAT family N-acetyltransferase [Bacillus infantis]|uniref:GNAT family N-acetyltransferase n=1 Tax=Bacillus infantis TaxID=324767 RepID=UPI003CF22785
MINLQEINEENWYECCQLKVASDQEAYMEPNAVSILQSHYEQTLRAFAILKNGKMAGLLMYNTVPEELDSIWIYRIMIDSNMQGQGIGKAAALLMIEQMAQLPGARSIAVGYHPDNLAAHHLYASLGFIDKGDRFGREMAVLKEL